MKGIRSWKRQRTAPVQPAVQPMTRADAEAFASQLEIVAVKIRACAELLDSTDRDELVGGRAALLIIGRDLADGLTVFGKRVYASMKGEGG